MGALAACPALRSRAAAGLPRIESVYEQLVAVRSGYGKA
jgi:hypothetical protein